MKRNARIARIYHILYLLILSPICMLTGCLTGGSEKQAGAQDFPNTIEAMGFWAQKVTDNAEKWNESANIDANIQQSVRPELLNPKNSALSKSMAPISDYDSVKIDSSEFVSGRVLQIRFKDDFFSQVRDTLLIRWDEAAKDSVLDNEWIYKRSGIIRWTFLGISHAYKYIDSTDDGKIDHRFQSTEFKNPDGTRTAINHHDAPGQDGNFETIDDNKTFFLEIIQRKLNDTLVADAWTDLDGKGKLWRKIPGDTSFFSYRKIKAGDSAQAGLVREEVNIGLFNGPSGILPNHLSVEHIGKDGTINHVEISGPRRDSTFFPGDTVYLLLSTDFNESDTLQHLELRFKIATVPFTWSPETLRMLNFEASAELRQGALKKLRLRFTPSLALMPGENIRSGQIDMNAEFKPSGSAQLLGRFSPSGLSGDIVDSEGKSYHAVWDTYGNRIE